MSQVLTEGDRFVTKAKAAKLLGTTTRTLRELLDAGEGPPVHYLPNGEERFLLSEITTWARADQERRQKIYEEKRGVRRTNLNK